MTLTVRVLEGSPNALPSFLQARGAIQKVRMFGRGEVVPAKAYENIQGGGGSSKNVRKLMQFSNGNYLRSIPNKQNCLLKTNTNAIFRVKSYTKDRILIDSTQTFDKF